MDDLRERVAVLEDRVDRLDEMEKMLHDINRQITRFHGAVGMFAFIVTGIGVAWNLFGDWLKAHFK